MRYKSKRNNYFQKVPKPTGPDWLSINGICLWLPPGKHISPKLGSFPPSLDLNFTGPGWIIAHSALNFILQYTFGDKNKYQVEWVKKIGKGLNKEVYRADVKLFQEVEQNIVFAVSLILGDADTNAGSRMIREFYVLDSINKEKPSFSIPEPVGIIWVNEIMVSVRSFVFGYQLELRTTKSNIERPWEIVAKIAAEIHNLQINNLPKEIKLYSTRRKHALAYFSNYERYNIPEIQDSLKWIASNLPKPENSVLVHSDLLGQNLYLTDPEGITVLDWEYTFYGDPAYDLAIVTRGVKKPFKVSGGLDYLVDSYLAAGGKELTKKDIYIYELFLILGWYQQSLDRSSGGHSPEYYLQQLKNMLKSVEK